MLLRNEKAKARDNLDESLGTYALIQEKLANYIDGVKNGCAPVEEIRNVVQYAGTVLSELRKIQYSAKTNSVMLDGDIDKAVFKQENIVKELSELSKSSRRAVR